MAKFTQELFDEMMLEIVNGKTINEICTGKDRPSKTTLFKWIKSNSDLMNNYISARTISADTLEAEIIELIDNITNSNYKTSRLKIDSLKWIAGRRNASKYI